jgi:hypothetical protein
MHTDKLVELNELFCSNIPVIKKNIVSTEFIERVRFYFNELVQLLYL